jgi:hypothetical protein
MEYLVGCHWAVEFETAFHRAVEFEPAFHQAVEFETTVLGYLLGCHWAAAFETTAIGQTRVACLENRAGLTVESGSYRDRVGASAFPWRGLR